MTAHAARLRRRQRTSLRRRALAIALAALAGVVAVTALPQLRHAAREITLPLRHEDVIRQQAADKGLDPSLIAGVIYTESHFRDQTSHAGARGLMQLTPQTARAIAQRTGGTAFTDADLATPQVNIAYGAWYLRHLLDQRRPLGRGARRRQAPARRPAVPRDPRVRRQGARDPRAVPPEVRARARAVAPG